MDSFRNVALSDLQNGYVMINKAYQCIFCDKVFHIGEIYKIEDRFFDAETAVKVHIQEEHNGVFHQLVALQKKDNTLTDVQKQFITLMYQEVSDKDIAISSGTAINTVRNQRFTLKEKAYQAKIFLAIYNLLNQKNDIDDFIMLPHKIHAKGETLMSTEDEKLKVFDAFLLSRDPLKLKAIPRKEKYKLLLLQEIIQLFQPGRIYSEAEVNQILKAVYQDYAAIRRYLIDYGFLTRTTDGSSYQL